MNEKKYTLNICHLYPDVLNLYGDTGNILCMKQRLLWRGIDCVVEEAPIGRDLNSKDFDIFFIGGGQDFEQEVLLRDAVIYKKSGIARAIDEDKVFLAICGGYQILGNYYKTVNGRQYDFMGCLNVYTEGNKDRLIGNYMFTCDDLVRKGVDGHIVGFENHSGKTYLGKDVRPMGKIHSGHGNNGEDGMEGARYKNVFATYSHGPVLPKNPALCDLLLKKALVRKYGEGKILKLARIDDMFENKAHNYMVERLSEAK